MNIKKMSVVSGYILEEESSLTLAELCTTCQAPAELIIRLVDHGVINPYEGATSRQWRFHRSTLIRTDKALRLKRDLGINLAGTALALELLDEIDVLRKQLNKIIEE
jgi:chaperone modulatory protein CbpM